MPNRFLTLLTWPARKLIALERQGRVVWSLALVDGAGLILWLLALNSFIFHRPLDEDDYSTIVGVTVACYALCLLYHLPPGRPWWHWPVKALLGHALAAVILHYIFVRLGLNLSGRQVLKLFASFLPLLLAGRLAYLACRRALPRAPLECVRLVMLLAAGLFLFSGRFLTSGGVLSGDAYWYCIMLGDFVTQLRAGVFPVFVGQSPWAFNGAVNPLRLAPCLQHLAGLVDLLTGQTLSFHALQNLTLLLCGLAGILSAYFCAVAILPGRRWTASALAVLYLACPGVLALAYDGDLFMSITTLPFAPLVAYGLWRTLQDDGTSIAWTALPLAAVWYCHPPIALWLTFAAVAAHAAIGLRRWRDPGLYAWWGRGLVLFLLAGGYTFVSVVTLRLPHTASSIDVILQNVRDAYPAMFLPVTFAAGAPGNFQIGWTLLTLGLLAAGAWAFRPRRSEGVLILGAGALLLLLIPFPGFNAALWRAMPHTVRDITYHDPMSRFYVVIAALTIVAAAGTMAKLIVKSDALRYLGGLLLALGVLWSFREASVFVTRDPHDPNAAPGPDPFLDTNNIILTRYAFNVFPSVPPYFSHGYMDPYLENRLLAADQETERGGNLAAVRPTGGKSIQLTSYFDGDRVVVLSPQFNLLPGVRYAAHFVPAVPPAAGSLLIVGQDAQRLYYMPDSSLGMLHTVPTNAFGFTPTSRDFFPIWTSLSQSDAIGIRYIFNEHPSAAIPANFARLTLTAYAVDRLPIRISSWVPYRAALTAPEEGDWLETPRVYIPGYAATVNGRAAELSRSPGGLVTVRLQPGENDVVLRYPGPWVLRASYWAALLTWTVVIGVLIRNAVRQWPRSQVA